SKCSWIDARNPGKLKASCFCWFSIVPAVLMTNRKSILPWQPTRCPGPKSRIAMSSTGGVLPEGVDDDEGDSAPPVDELPVEAVELSPVVFAGTVVGDGVPRPDASAWPPLLAQTSTSAGSKGRCRRGMAQV